MSIIFEKIGGVHLKGNTGAVKEGDQVAVDQNGDWITSFHRALEWYLKSNTDEDIYEVIFSFPSANDLGQFMPLKKTLIHFEIDTIRNPSFGFGDNIIAHDVDTHTQSLTTYEALCHDLNVDIGIWASSVSGGVTARLRTYKLLNDIFAGASAYESALGIGFEIKTFSGGQFLKEEINDIEVFRVTGITLTVRVYSKKLTYAVPYIGTIIQDQELTDADGDRVS